MTGHPPRSLAELPGVLEGDGLEFLMTEPDAPRLAAPDTDDVVHKARVDPIREGYARRAVLAAMREAAEKRIVGVTGPDSDE